MASSGAAALSVGSVVDLNQAISKFPELIFQGNVDNRILAQGNSETIREATENCLKQTHGKRHILNLNHGLLENTSLDSVINFINISKSILMTP
jgi:uroporphyrinogen decarboxylase